MGPYVQVVQRVGGLLASSISHPLWWIYMNSNMIYVEKLGEGGGSSLLHVSTLH